MISPTFKGKYIFMWQWNIIKFSCVITHICIFQLLLLSLSGETPCIIKINHAALVMLAVKDLKFISVLFLFFSFKLSKKTVKVLFIYISFKLSFKVLLLLLHKRTNQEFIFERVDWINTICGSTTFHYGWV